MQTGEMKDVCSEIGAWSWSLVKYV